MYDSDQTRQKPSLMAANMNMLVFSRSSSHYYLIMASASFVK